MYRLELNLILLLSMNLTFLVLALKLFCWKYISNNILLFSSEASMKCLANRSVCFFLVYLCKSTFYILLWIFVCILENATNARNSRQAQRKGNCRFYLILVSRNTLLDIQTDFNNIVNPFLDVIFLCSR